MSQGNIDFVRDNRLKIGDKISDHEKQLDSVDAVIILLTPEYYSKIKKRAGGVYREYNQIWHRVSRAEANRRRTPKAKNSSQRKRLDEFILLPILFAGSLEESCPEEMKDRIAGDFLPFRGLRDRNKRLYVSDRQRIDFEPLIKQNC